MKPYQQIGEHDFAKAPLGSFQLLDEDERAQFTIALVIFILLVVPAL